MSIGDVGLRARSFFEERRFVSMQYVRRSPVMSFKSWTTHDLAREERA
jgi:hypothetical protein